MNIPVWIYIGLMVIVVAMLSIYVTEFVVITLR